jgi:hypothetical protein
MVFIVGCAIFAIPAIAQTGELGLATVVWSVIATACFLPSFVIAWQTLAASRRAGKLRSAVAYPADGARILGLASERTA